ncbi:MAG: gluconolaconase [Vicinamibacterales bacterium]
MSPSWAIPGGRVTIAGSDFRLDAHVTRLPGVRIGPYDARVVFARPTELVVVVPPEVEGGRMPVRLDDVAGTTVLLDVGVPVATGLHLVDSPVFDADGNLFVTFSGTRGQQAPISIFKVTPGGAREPFATGILNPTSLAIDPAGRLYVSSRFEGAVYRVGDTGAAEPFATDLGVACGLAFNQAGQLYVGDRSGSIFKVAHDGSATLFASLPASVAAFHLAYGPDESLYVTGPTLAPRDALYRVDPEGHVDVVWSGFGRPQGLAFDAAGSLYVVEALAGSSGLYRLRRRTDGRLGEPDLVVASASLIGVAIDPAGGLVVASADTVYRLDVPVRGR